MKTIFDVMCDGASCYVPAWDPLSFFRCQMFPFHSFCYGRDYKVFGANGKVLGQNLQLIACYRNVFGVVNDDDTFSFYKTTGEVLGENATSYRLFEANMLALFFNKKAVLMRADGSVVHQGALAYEVAQDGLSFFAQKEDGNWTLYSIDGGKIEENIKSFLMKSSDFYVLYFPDNSAFVYGKQGVKTFQLPDKAIITLHDFNMFSVEHKGKIVLYQADGARLLESARGFEVLANGLVWANPYAKDDCLYGARLKPILVRFGLCCADNCGYLFRGDKDYLFDEKGRHITTYPLNSTMACGSGYYIALDGKKDVVVLHRPDASVLAANLVGAIVYPNHWKVLFYSRNDENVGARAHGLPLCSLLDDKDNVIVENADVLAYLYYFGAYVFAKDGKYSLLNAKGEVIEAGADLICVFGDVYVVQREGQMMEVHFLANIDA